MAILTCKDLCFAYDGSTVFYGDMFQKGKKDPQPIGTFGYMQACSEDGDTFLFQEYYTHTSGGESKEIHTIGIHAGKTEEIIFEAPDPTYGIQLLTYTPDCREALFSYRDSTYYFSLAEVRRLQRAPRDRHEWIPRSAAQRHAARDTSAAVVDDDRQLAGSGKR